MSQSSSPARNAPAAKQVTKISPLMPISVLIMTSSQAFRVLHKHCLADQHGLSHMSQMCSKQVDRYFSLEPANHATCLLVESFKAAIGHPASRVLLLEFAGVVAVITLVGIISANRSSAGLSVRWGTTVFMMLMQAIGGAVALPIYFSLIVYNSSSSARASFIPSGVARALIPAVVCGYVIPSIALLAPGLFSSVYIWEWALAFWQIFPILVSGISIVLSYCFTGTKGLQTTSDAMISTTFIVGSMDTVILGSFLMHVYALYSAYDQGFVLMDFVPEYKLTSLEQVMHAFFTFDFLGFLVSLWTLIFYDTSRFAGVGKTSVISAVLLAVFGTVLLGPGGSAAWAWSNIEKARLGALVADRPQKKPETNHVTKA